MDARLTFMFLLCVLSVQLTWTLASAEHTPKARTERVFMKQRQNEEELFRVKRHKRSSEHGVSGETNHRIHSFRDVDVDDGQRSPARVKRVRREMLDEPVLNRVKRKQIRDEPALNRVKRKQIRDEQALYRVNRKPMKDELALSRVKRKHIRDEQALNRVKRKQIRDEPALYRVKRKQIRDGPALHRVKRKQIRDGPALSRVKRKHIRDEPALSRVKRKPIQNEPTLYRVNQAIDNSAPIEKALERVKRIKRHTAIAIVTNKARAHRLRQLRRRKRAYELANAILNSPGSVVKKDGKLSHRNADVRTHHKTASSEQARKHGPHHNRPSANSNHFRRGKKSSAIQAYHSLVSRQAISRSTPNGRFRKKTQHRANTYQHEGKKHKHNMKRSEKADRHLRTRARHLRKNASERELLRVKRTR